MVKRWFEPERGWWGDGGGFCLLDCDTISRSAVYLGTDGEHPTSLLCVCRREKCLRRLSVLFSGTSTPFRLLTPPPKKKTNQTNKQARKNTTNLEPKIQKQSLCAAPPAGSGCAG